MSIAIALLPSTIPSQAGKYIFRIQPGNTVTVEEMATVIATQTSLQENLIKAVINSYNDLLVGLLQDGKRPALGELGYLAVSATGSADRPDASLQAAHLQINLGTTPAFLKRFRQEVSLERVTLPAQREPRLDFQLDKYSGSLNVVAPGEMAMVRGEHLDFDPSQELEGLFVRANPEVMWQRVSSYNRTGEKLVEFIWPETLPLITATGWQLKLATSYDNPTGSLRETVYRETLWRRPLFKSVRPVAFTGTKGNGRLTASKIRQNDGSIKLQLAYRAPEEVSEGTGVEIVTGTTDYTLTSSTVANTLAVWIAAMPLS